MKEIKRLFEVATIIVKEVIAAFKGEHKKNKDEKKHTSEANKEDKKDESK